MQENSVDYTEEISLKCCAFHEYHKLTKLYISGFHFVTSIGSMSGKSFAVKLHAKQIVEVVSL